MGIWKFVKVWVVSSWVVKDVLNRPVLVLLKMFTLNDGVRSNLKLKFLIFFAYRRPQRPDIIFAPSYPQIKRNIVQALQTFCRLYVMSLSIFPV